MNLFLHRLYGTGRYGDSIGTFRIVADFPTYGNGPPGLGRSNCENGIMLRVPRIRLTPRDSMVY